MKKLNLSFFFFLLFSWNISAQEQYLLSSKFLLEAKKNDQIVNLNDSK